MKQQDYHTVITAKATASKAFACVCDVAAWWTNCFEGSSQKPGDIFTVSFGSTFVTFEVSSLITDQKIVWQVIDCNLPFIKDKKEWMGTKIEWLISTSGDATQTGMTHIGLVPGIECYTECEKGWNFYVRESLSKLISDGKGLPDTPKAERVMG